MLVVRILWNGQTSIGYMPQGKCLQISFYKVLKTQKLKSNKIQYEVLSNVHYRTNSINIRIILAKFKIHLS